jgi:cytochrome P450
MTSLRIVLQRFLAVSILLNSVKVEAFVVSRYPNTLPSTVRKLTSSGRFATSVDSTPTLTPLSSLPLPPQKGGLFRRFRDTFDYLKDMQGFMTKRSAELGPVFRMYMFFRPIVVVGGQDAVGEFIKGKELQAEVVYPQLPQPFLTLHTKWGALSLDANDILFKQARGLFKDVLQTPEALSYHVKTIEPEIERYVQALVQRVKNNPDKEFYLVEEIKDVCLQVFSKIFSGQGLSEEQVQMFIDYNAALLELGERTGQFKKGKAALDTLKVEMLRRFHDLDDPSIDASVAGKFYHDQVAGREGFENDERIGTMIVLFVWAAYIECAALMIGSLALMQKYKGGARGHVLQELKGRQLKARDPIELKFWTSMPYTVGVLRETLRLQPPGGGVPRYGPSDFMLAGYRIPAKMAVMMEPRIVNRDPNLYAEPLKFEPFRWTSESKQEESASSCPLRGTALNRGPGSWFPGGNGAHRCPGVPLAELVSTMFVAKVSDHFTSWEFGGSGLTSDGEINYESIPVRICPPEFGLKFHLAK